MNEIEASNDSVARLRMQSLKLREEWIITRLAQGLLSMARFTDHKGKSEPEDPVLG